MTEATLHAHMHAHTHRICTRMSDFLCSFTKCVLRELYYYFLKFSIEFISETR